MLKFFLSQGFDIYMSLLQEMASDWTVSSDVQCNWFVCTKTNHATMVFHSFKLSPQQLVYNNSHMFCLDQCKNKIFFS